MTLPYEKPIFEKVNLKRTFMTSASRSSIFVESGSSLWRLTSNRSVLAASSGCFTSTDMIVSPQSTAQFAVVSRLKRALQRRRQSNPWSKALWDAQNWAGTRLIFNIPAYIIYYSQRANQGREWSREKKGQSSRTFNGFVPITRWHFSLRETSFCMKHKAKQFPFGKSINSQS